MAKEKSRMKTEASGADLGMGIGEESKEKLMVLQHVTGPVEFVGDDLLVFSSELGPLLTQFENSYDSIGQGFWSGFGNQDAIHAIDDDVGRAFVSSGNDGLSHLHGLYEGSGKSASGYGRMDMHVEAGLNGEGLGKR